MGAATELLASAVKPPVDLSAQAWQFPFAAYLIEKSGQNYSVRRHGCSFDLLCDVEN
jgi:hypothetical protein